jgi:glycosyltransferase involved in cell wall biosynthesis
MPKIENTKESVLKRRRRHILFIVENAVVPPDSRVWYEALAAKEWGYNVTVVCPKGMDYNRSFEMLNGINIYRHPLPEADGNNSYVMEYIFALLYEIVFSIWIFLKEPFHIVHGANPPDHLFLVAGLFKLFGVKYVFDHHDLTPETYLAKFKRKGLLHKLLLLMEKANFKMADAVISTNESYKSVAVQRGGKDGKDVFVVRNGPRLNCIKVPPPNLKWKGNYKYLAAYIGLIGAQDQLDVLLRIIDCIVNQRKIATIKFIVIGNGPNWKQIVQQANEMNLSKYVEFTGFIPYGHMLFEILATADVCVNPEFRNEFTDKSTMIKIMEYMCFGKPIIQFDTTEGRVSAGDASLYVKENSEQAFADVLINLIHDSCKRERMGKVGQQRIKDFLQWDIQKLELNKVYRFLSV